MLLHGLVLPPFGTTVATVGSAVTMEAGPERQCGGMGDSEAEPAPQGDKDLGDELSNINFDPKELFSFVFYGRVSALVLS